MQGQQHQKSSNHFTCSTSLNRYDTQGICRTVKYIKWIYPPNGWVKLNFDGAAKGCPGRAGCGGILRGHDGAWIRGFKKRIGTCEAIGAELWGVVHGICLAQEMGVTKLIVEGDSTTAIRKLQEAWKEGETRSMIINTWLSKQECNMQIEFVHTYREGNTLADHLANSSLEDSFDLCILERPPPQMRQLLYRDYAGFAIPRTVSDKDE